MEEISPIMFKANNDPKEAVEELLVQGDVLEW